MKLLAKNILFTILVPGTVAVYVPLNLTGDLTTLMDWRLLPACVLVLSGAALYAWCIERFIRSGKGTPAPVDPPRVLVIQGPYRVVRNPMYLSVLLVISGWLVVAPTRSLAIYVMGVFLWFHVFVMLYEERRLSRQFGAQYADYCTRVNRWIPKWPARLTTKTRGKSMKNLLLVLFFLSAAQAAELEDYFGKYQSTARQNQIVFEFGKGGVTGLVVDGVPVKTGVTYDILGIFEGSMFLRIDYVDSNKRQCVIRSLILVENRRFVVASGFSLAYRLDANNQPKTLQTYTFELKRR